MAVKQALTSTNINQTDLILFLQDVADAITALKADHNTLRAKLNADAGVTDVDYAASTATAPSLTP